MSNRYWITGVQLGLLMALEQFQERRKLIEEIIDKQDLEEKKK